MISNYLLPHVQRALEVISYLQRFQCLKWTFNDLNFYLGIFIDLNFEALLC